MKIQNRNISAKFQIVVLGVAMLIVPPGGAVQMNMSYIMPALVTGQPLNEAIKKKSVINQIKQKVRDCSIGIPCKRKVVDYRIGRQKAVALAVMMRLGMKARIN